jgi:hypothetical protein
MAARRAAVEPLTHRAIERAQKRLTACGRSAFELYMANQETYKGGCHCGKVSYEVKADLSQQVIACNCSICQKKGHLLTFLPAEQFRLLSGEDALTDYQFNTKNIHHLFCSTCGVQSFTRGTGRDGKQMVSINVRCLEGVDLDKVKVTPYDGRHA